MKKTIKFFSMAALAMLGAMTVSCSSDNDELISEQSVNKKNLVTTTLTVGFDDATTRTLTDNGTTLTNTFTVGDKIVVFYNDSHNMSMRAESEPLAAGDITNEGKKATFTITLTDPKLGNSSGFRAVYPASMAVDAEHFNPAIAPNVDSNTIDYSKLETQDGTLATIGSQLNLATYQGWLKDGKIPSFTLENKLAIAKFKINLGGSYITLVIKGLTITDGTNNYTITPSFLDDIYVAMKPVGTSKTLSFDMHSSANTFNKTVTGKELKAGHVTPIDLKVYEYVTLDNVTNLEKGWLIFDDGKAYNPTLMPSYGTPVAMIAYVGKESDCTHGLAIALEDLYNGNTFPANTKDNRLSEFATANPVTGGTWRIPSADDIKYMCKACGGDDYTSTLVDDLSINAGNLRTMIETAGGTAPNAGGGSYVYILSNTDDSKNWCCGFTVSTVWFNSFNNISSSVLGRAVLAF